MKKKIMAMVLAVLCLTMILPVAVLADDPKTVINEVTLGDPVDKYEVGEDAYYLAMGFMINSTDPETTNAVTTDPKVYVENGTDWKSCPLGAEIEAGKKYKAVVKVMINVWGGGEDYCFNANTKINYDTAKFEAAGVTVTETSRNDEEICLEVIYPALAGPEEPTTTEEPTTEEPTTQPTTEQPTTQPTTEQPTTAAPQGDNPKTGDSNNVWIYIAIAVLALGTAVGAGVVRKKANR